MPTRWKIAYICGQRPSSRPSFQNIYLNISHLPSHHNLGQHPPVAVTKHHTSKLPLGHTPVGLPTIFTTHFKLPITMPVLHTSTFIRRSPAECREIVCVLSLTPSQSAAPPSHPFRRQNFPYHAPFFLSAIARAGCPSTTTNGRASCQHAVHPSWHRLSGIAITLNRTSAHEYFAKH